MRGRTLLLVGAILTISNASGPLAAGTSIAQSPSLANGGDLKETTVRRKAKKMPSPAPKITQRTRPSIAPQHTTFVAPSRPLLPVVDQPDIGEREKFIADEVLRLLPTSCQPQLKDFYVRYDKPERRGLAGKDSVIIDGTLSDDEFRAVLVHEALGHVFDLGCLKGNPRSGASAFRDGKEIIFNSDPSTEFYGISWQTSHMQKPGATEQDFVSGYARSDPFEDLAESAAYFILHRHSFEERAQTNAALLAKLRWFETFLPQSTPLALENESQWNSNVPWDVTKLPYTWLGRAYAVNMQGNQRGSLP